MQRLLPRKKLKALLQDEYHCSRLPAWFMVWFVVGIGLFCRDSYRQVFRWLQPLHGAKTPPRSTFCEARKRLGVAPLRHLVDKVVELLGTPATPGAFYQKWRLMAIDGFVLDVALAPANERAFGRPKSGRTGLSRRSAVCRCAKRGLMFCTRRSSSRSPAAKSAWPKC